MAHHAQGVIRGLASASLSALKRGRYVISREFLMPHAIANRCRLFGFGLLLLMASSSSLRAQIPAVKADRPVAAIKRVLIISIDGLRPDLLLRAKAPRMHALLKSGSFTFWAQTAAEAYTLPCHVSMLTGVSSKIHRVTWNDYIEESYPESPTLFELAKKAGYSTALVSGKMKFITFTKPGTLDWHWLPPDEPVEDAEVARQAVKLMRAHQPEVLFVHFPGVDNTGHAKDWGSPEQLRAVEIADKATGTVLDALVSLKLAGSTLVIVTADHGGAAKDHGEGDPRSLCIPWIATGPGVRRDFDLTRVPDLSVHIEDTFATACALLGIDPGKSVEGKAVMSILRAGAE